MCSQSTSILNERKVCVSFPRQAIATIADEPSIFVEFFDGFGVQKTSEPVANEPTVELLTAGNAK
jgi:hypothetical protein